VDDFETFFERNYGAVVRAVALAIGDRSRAEDAVQEAFGRAYRRWRSVSAMDRPVTCVYVVALNTRRKEWRRETRRTRVPIDDDAVADHSDPIVTAMDLRAALLRLTPRQRAAVVLRYLADLSTKDVAAALGCAEGTVKATLHQALRKLRVELGDDTDEDDEEVAAP
jgi:RNA polymerase sigma-70 factor (sigma-E family)